MTMPIVVYRPTLILQPIDENGDPDGSPVDVSCDVSRFELDVDVPTTQVTTFCGNFEIPDEIEVSATVEVTVNADTYARWAALVGDSVEVQVKDRTTDTAYRAFDSQIQLNPALYGPTEPGEARAFDFSLPVLSAVTLVEPS